MILQVGIPLDRTLFPLIQHLCSFKEFFTG
jgi:hypothetical protein